MQEDQLLEVFKVIIKHNPKAVLTGSLALKLQNIKLPRLSEDVDIYIPCGETFIPFYGGDLAEAGLPPLYFNNTLDEIEEEKTKRTSFIYGLYASGEGEINLKVDVFQPNNINNIGLSKIYCNDIPCEHFSNILKRKTFYALNGSAKHKSDLIFILNNNEYVGNKENENGESIYSA